MTNPIKDQNHLEEWVKQFLESFFDSVRATALHNPSDLNVDVGQKDNPNTLHQLQEAARDWEVLALYDIIIQHASPLIANTLANLLDLNPHDPTSIDQLETAEHTGETLCTPEELMRLLFTTYAQGFLEGQQFQTQRITQALQDALYEAKLNKLYEQKE